MAVSSQNSQVKSKNRKQRNNRFKGLLLVVVLRILSLLPFGFAQRIGHLMGKLASSLPGKLKTTTQKNLVLCFPDASQYEIQQLFRQTFLHSGMLAVEMALAWLWPVEKCLKQIRNIHDKNILDRAMRGGTGVICIVPHLGNWEFLNYHILDSYPGMAMYKPAKIPALNDLILNGRKQSGLEMASADASGVKAVFKHLKKGGVVFILADQEPDEKSGIFAPFFGIPALSMTLIAKLTQRTNARVIAAFAKRLDDHLGFDVYYKSGSEKLYSSDLLEAVTALNELVESCVQDIPEQYQWTYKRFKKRPGDAARFY